VENALLEKLKLAPNERIKVQKSPLESVLRQFSRSTSNPSPTEASPEGRKRARNVQTGERTRVVFAHTKCWGSRWMTRGLEFLSWKQSDSSQYLRVLLSSLLAPRPPAGRAEMFSSTANAQMERKRVAFHVD